MEQIVTVTNRQCVICGVKFHWSGLLNQYGSFPDNNSCRNCQFWTSHFMRRNNPNVARIDGQHYIIGDGQGPINGMGGIKHVIEFIDGRIVETSDLWHQGVIPELWREYLTNNAVFVEG